MNQQPAGISQPPAEGSHLLRLPYPDKNLRYIKLFVFSFLIYGLQGSDKLLLGIFHTIVPDSVFQTERKRILSAEAFLDNGISDGGIICGAVEQGAHTVTDR